MIKSIEIEKFRGIENGKLDDFTPLTILVGPNSSGKSTVLDALFLGASTDPYKATSHFAGRNRNRLEARWLINNPHHNNEAVIKLTTDFLLNEETESRWFQIKLQDGEQPEVNIYFDPNHTGPNFNLGGQTLFMTLHNQGISASNRIETCLGVSDISYVDFDQDQNAVSLVDLYTRSIELGRRIPAQKALNEILPRLVQVEILTYKNQPRLQTVYEDRSVPLAAEGEGIQAFMRLSLSLSACADGTALLEEPEVHQYPRSLRMSAKTIVLAVNRGVQVVVSTHSLELIDALLTEAKEVEILDKVSVFRLLLKDGCLKHSRTSGVDAEFVRFQIEDDLR